MANLIVVEPFAVAASQITVNRGASKELLLDPERKHVFVDSVDGSVLTIDIDLLATTSWDTVGLVGLNAAGVDTWRVLGGATVTQTIYLASRNLIASESWGPPYNAALFHSAEVLSGRYVRVEIARTAGKGLLTLGCLVIGKAFRPTWNIETDSGRGIIDTGVGARRYDGGRQARPGVRVPARSWTFGDLDDSELRSLYGIVHRQGENGPVLVSEDPDFSAGATERIGWGCFTSVEQYARRDPGKHRWSLRFEDWL